MNGNVAYGLALGVVMLLFAWGEDPGWRRRDFILAGVGALVCAWLAWA